MGPIDLVIDTSAILAVLLNEPPRPAILDATRGARALAAPSLPWEVGNALVALLRRRRIRGQAMLEAWESFIHIPVRYVAVDVPEALRIAETHGIYAYDAYAIAAARSAGVALLTLDRAMARAARNAGADVMEVAP